MATDAPDTDELILRDIETAIRAARVAFDAAKWDEAALHIGFAGQQINQLADYLGPRLKVPDDPAFWMG